MVSHRTQSAQEIARFASLRRPLRDRKVEGGEVATLRRPLRDRKVEGGEVATLRPPRPASRPKRGPGTIMIASGYTITCLPTIVKHLVLCI
jgi:hypothetical protein